MTWKLSLKSFCPSLLSWLKTRVERDAALEAASYPWDIEFQLSGHPLSPCCCHCHHEVRKLPLERQGPQNITVIEAHREWQGTLGSSTELQTLSLPLMCSLEHDWKPVVGLKLKQAYTKVCFKTEKVSRGSLSNCVKVWRKLSNRRQDGPTETHNVQPG